jgi:hypothetical protein
VKVLIVATARSNGHILNCTNRDWWDIEKTFVLTHLEGFLVVSGLYYDSSPPLPGDN